MRKVLAFAIALLLFFILFWTMCILLITRQELPLMILMGSISAVCGCFAVHYHKKGAGLAAAILGAVAFLALSLVLLVVSSGIVE